MVHEEYKEMLSAHALATLDQQAERALNEHLAGCAECRGELDHWNETAALMALTAEPMEPSPQVRIRILQEISSDAGLQEKPITRSIRGSHVLQFKQPPRNVWSSVGSLGAIAAAVVFGALIVALIVLWQQNRAMKTELAKLTGQTQLAQEELEHTREALQFLTTPGAQMAELSGTKMAPAASAKIAYDKTGHAMLMAQNLPEPPPEKAYQLWYIVNNKPMPGKVFTTNSEGKGMLKDQMPPEAHNGAVFAITMEPKNGVESPTGQIYLQSGI